MPATAPYLPRRSKSDSSRSSASLGGSRSCFAAVEARFTGRALLGGGGGRGESGIGPALVAPGLSRLLTVSLRPAIARRPIAAADEDEDDDDDDDDEEGEEEEEEEEEEDDDDGSSGGDGDLRGFLAGVSASCGACLFCLRLPSALVPSPCDTR
eukprot:COSAG05_NODE_284_length_12237_cov_15.252266_8_plen_154_part_00